jgi:N-acetylglucosamine-6-phosphate deacetylase
MAYRLGVQAALVDNELIAGDVSVQGGLIESIGLAPAGTGGIALPGFIDLQVNGFAGVDFIGAEPGDYVVAAEAMAATGVTGFVANFVSSNLEDYGRALAAAGAAATGLRPRLLGVHMEGPFLSPTWAGAHDRDNLRDPDAGLVDGWMEQGPVVMMTLAPELPGAIELIHHLGERGVGVSVGHTDADAATAHAAFDAGAASMTHVFNAHRRFSPRDPGPAAVALSRDDVAVMVILDGQHLAPDTEAMVLAAAGDRVVAVTDAMAAAGLGEGTHKLGGRQVEVMGGAVRLPDGTLAGSVLSLDRALRVLLDRGMSLEASAVAVAHRPARLLGLPGVLAPGMPADIAVVDDGYSVSRTIVLGKEAFAG